MTPPKLYTPGPVTTSAGVKAAMQRDIGPRDQACLAATRAVREGLVRLVAPAAPAGYTAVLMPGDGACAAEATLGTVVPSDGRVLVLSNGADGDRLAAIAGRLGVACDRVRVPDDRSLEPATLEAALGERRDITHIAVVHAEATGILNPVAGLAGVAASRRRTMIVDVTRSLGALPIDMPALGIQYLVGAAHACLEAAPGVAFVIADRAALASAPGEALSFSLDLAAQASRLDTEGEFRVTPPTHLLLALAQALDELRDEGGVAVRGARYARNQRCLVQAMRAVGFRPWLAAEVQGPIVTSFKQPPPPFGFPEFHVRMQTRGFVLAPGVVTSAETFGVASIGQLYPRDMEALARAAQDVLAEMGIRIRAA